MVRNSIDKYLVMAAYKYIDYYMYVELSKIQMLLCPPLSKLCCLHGNLVKFVQRSLLATFVETNEKYVVFLTVYNNNNKTLFKHRQIRDCCPVDRCLHTLR